jgi:hypothetical protein
MKGKPTPKSEAVEIHPDGWERFERAVDKVMHSPPKPKKAKDRALPSPKRGGRRGGKGPA